MRTLAGCLAVAAVVLTAASALGAAEIQGRAGGATASAPDRAQEADVREPKSPSSPSEAGRPASRVADRSAERAVAAALNWLARHQSANGRWSFADYTPCCKEPPCDGQGEMRDDRAATAMALLCLFGAGQTHQSKGPYQKVILRGLEWLLAQRQADENAQDAKTSRMVDADHGNCLTTIVLTQAFAVTRDPMLGKTAQRAIRAMEASRLRSLAKPGQCYLPGRPDDSSWITWRLLASIAARSAGLSTDGARLQELADFLLMSAPADNTDNIDRVSVAAALGLMAGRARGLSPNDSRLLGFATRVAHSQPGIVGRDAWYCFFAAQELYRDKSPAADAWKRKLRAELSGSQCTQGCTTGSWDPLKPLPDAWAKPGGRLMVTCLSTLALTAYYRYLPIWQPSAGGSTASPEQAAPLAVAPFDAATARSHQGACAARMNRSVELTNSIGMKLVLIPAGEFEMGSRQSLEEKTKALDGYLFDLEKLKREQPGRWVRIARPFYLGSREVTRGQFRKFVEDWSRQTDPEEDAKGAFGWDEQKGLTRDRKYSWKHIGFTQTDEHPVVDVSWNDAREFCRWLSRKENAVYRLPTEAEWEYACRAGTLTPYSSGEDPETLAGVANVLDATAKEQYPQLEKAAIHARDGHLFTAPGGQFRPNAFGIHDMHGNVWEWCADECYDSTPVEKAGQLNFVVFRAIRGGSWVDGPAMNRSTSRYGAYCRDGFPFVGFRVLKAD